MSPDDAGLLASSLLTPFRLADLSSNGQGFRFLKLFHLYIMSRQAAE